MQPHGRCAAAGRSATTARARPGRWCAPSTRCSPRGAGRAARRLRGRAGVGRPRSTWCRRWRCSATWSTSRSGRRSCRSPRSAPSGRRSCGRSSTACRCGPSTCRWPTRWSTCATTSCSWPTRPVGDPLAALAAAAGDPDPERWWDDVIEHRGDGDARVRRRGRGDGGGARRARGRLRCARRSARPTCARCCARPSPQGHERIAVVCGAWHVPALQAPLPPASPSIGARSPGCAKVKVGVSWVPWTHRRLAAATGYGAGVRSPGWYAHVFRHPGPVGGQPLVRRRRPAAARPWALGVARPPHRRHARRRRAGGAARPAASGARRGARRRRHGDGRQHRAGAHRARAGGGRRHRRGARRRAAGAARPRPRSAAAQGAAEADAPTRDRRARRAHAQRAAPARCCCTACARWACRGAGSRRAAAPAARSARPGRCGGSPSSPSVSSSCRRTAPRSEPLRRIGCSSRPRRPSALADLVHVLELALLADLPDVVQPVVAQVRGSTRRTTPTSCRSSTRSVRSPGRCATAMCAAPTRPRCGRCSTGWSCACWPAR